MVFVPHKNQALLEGEFLPIFTKLIPFFGLISAVLSVVIINALFKEIFARSYMSKVVTTSYRFFSHK